MNVMTMTTVKIVLQQDGTISYSEIGPRMPLAEKKLKPRALVRALRRSGMAERDIKALTNAFTASGSAMLTFIPQSPSPTL
jgi:hypothetical protein